jgi:hypothetical protein
MTLRAVLGWLVMVLLCGAVVAQQPRTPGPLSEGREVDPVARDFFLPVPPPGPITTGPTAPTQKRGDLVGSFIGAMCEAILQRLTIPLGTVRPDGTR